MEFYLVDVKSLKLVDGEDVCFDYINTYYDEIVANREAQALSFDTDVLEISVHKWILHKDGTDDIIDNYSGFRYLNRNHREIREEQSENI